MNAEQPPIECPSSRSGLKEILIELCVGYSRMRPDKVDEFKDVSREVYDELGIICGSETAIDENLGGPYAENPGIFKHILKFRDAALVNKRVKPRKRQKV